MRLQFMFPRKIHISFCLRGSGAGYLNLPSLGCTEPEDNLVIYFPLGICSGLRWLGDETSHSAVASHNGIVSKHLSYPNRWTRKFGPNMRSVEPQDLVRFYWPKSMVVPVGMMLKGYQRLKRGNGPSP